MLWFVHYTSGTASGVGTASTLPLAVKEACVLLDDGMDVTKIANNHGVEGMNADEIRRIWGKRRGTGLSGGNVSVARVTR